MSAWSDSGDGAWSDFPTVTWEEVYNEGVTASVSLAGSAASGAVALDAASDGVTPGASKFDVSVAESAVVASTSLAALAASINTAVPVVSDLIVPGAVSVPDCQVTVGSVSDLRWSEPVQTWGTFPTEQWAEGESNQVYMQDAVAFEISLGAGISDGVTPGEATVGAFQSDVGLSIGVVLTAPVVSQSVASLESVSDFLWTESSETWNTQPTEPWSAGEANQVYMQDVLAFETDLGASIVEAATLNESILPYIEANVAPIIAVTLLDAVATASVVDLESVSDFLWTEASETWETNPDETWDIGEANQVYLQDALEFTIDWNGFVVEAFTPTDTLAQVSTANVLPIDSISLVATVISLSVVDLAATDGVAPTADAMSEMNSFEVVLFEAITPGASVTPIASAAFSIGGGIELSFSVDAFVDIWNPCYLPLDTIWTPDNESDTVWFEGNLVSVEWLQAQAHNTEFLKEVAKTNSWDTVEASTTTWTPEAGKDDDWSE